MISRKHEAFELDLLLDAIRGCSGYDFSNYARGTLKRRLQLLVTTAGLENLADMIPLVLHDDSFLGRLVRSLSIPVTHMFRDPSFFSVLRERVFPMLQDRKVLKIWHAGCATGEEVYSLAILLQEAGLYDRARIFATDINNEALEKAAEGIYSIPTIQKGTPDYLAAGGSESLASYYHSVYGSAKMKENLKSNVVFSHHDLVTGAPFGKMDLILCRNVTIYFNRSLQDRVYSLFANSMATDGYLALGSQESIDYSAQRDTFIGVDSREKIYRWLAVGAESDRFPTRVSVEDRSVSDSVVAHQRRRPHCDRRL